MRLRKPYEAEQEGEVVLAAKEACACRAEEEQEEVTVCYC